MIDPDALGGTDVYRTRVETLIAEMTRDVGVRLPGQRRRSLAATAEAEGVLLSPALHRAIAAPGGVTNSMTAVVTRRAALLLNVAHAIDHMFLLIFATAVAAIAVDFGFPDWESLMPYGVGAFMLFGLGSLPAGRLGDLWGRRQMMLVFFFGMGASALLIAHDTRRVAARGRADADGGVLVDLSPGGYSDARAGRAAPGVRDRRQRARGKPRRRLRGRDDGPARQVRRLARGVRRARLARDRLRLRLRARRAARGGAAGEGRKARPRRTTRRRSRASSS